jgi:ATP-binding cassette subfamily C (CFTR/MRP) protein 4
VVGIINPWAFIPAGIAASGMFFVRYQFAGCSRDLKRLAGTTRSPLYSQMTSTIHGLKVIRSYHAENICTKEFHDHLNDIIKVDYLTVTLNRWSAMRFDWVSLIFIALVTLFAMIARVTQQRFSVVEIALTLTYSLGLMGLLQLTIRFG